MLLQLVDAARDVLDAVLQDLLGDLFLTEDDNLIDRAYAMLQILANGQDLADHMGERENALSARSTREVSILESGRLGRENLAGCGSFPETRSHPSIRI